MRWKNTDILPKEVLALTRPDDRFARKTRVLKAKRKAAKKLAAKARRRNQGK